MVDVEGCHWPPEMPAARTRCSCVLCNSASQLQVRHFTHSFTIILSNFVATGGQENLQIGNMTVPALTTALQPASTVFPQVAIARGVLTCCDKAILLEDVSRNDKVSFSRFDGWVCEFQLL